MARVVRRLADGTRVLAVVKADAYGHGAVPVARALLGEPGLWGFGVGDSQEALELRAAGIDAPILILGTIIPEEEAQVVSHDVRVCVHSMDRVGTLEDESRRQGRRTRVHLMVDTGMGRLGALPGRALDLARVVAASRWLELEGLATHMSSSKPGHPFTAVQRQRLLSLLADLRRDHIEPPLVHFANTAAILGGDGGSSPLVRPGISLYGVLGPDTAQAAGPLGLEPVMSLRTQIVYLKDVPAGTPIGYNGTHVTAHATRVATLPVGYNDGLAYRLSNRGRAIVRGEIAPIVGAISMDYTMLDVGPIPGVRVGDAVTLIGSEGARSITIPELASLVGTIPYEISCAVGKRVHRLYVREEREELEGRRDETAGAPLGPEVIPAPGAAAAAAADKRRVPVAPLPAAMPAALPAPAAAAATRRVAVTVKPAAAAAASAEASSAAPARRGKGSRKAAGPDGMKGSSGTAAA